MIQGKERDSGGWWYPPSLRSFSSYIWFLGLFPPQSTRLLRRVLYHCASSRYYSTTKIVSVDITICYSELLWKWYPMYPFFPLWPSQRESLLSFLSQPSLQGSLNINYTSVTLFSHTSTHLLCIQTHTHILTLTTLFTFHSSVISRRE